MNHSNDLVISAENHWVSKQSGVLMFHGKHTSPVIPGKGLFTEVSG